MGGEETEQETTIPRPACDSLGSGYGENVRWRKRENEERYYTQKAIINRDKRDETCSIGTSDPWYVKRVAIRQEAEVDKTGSGKRREIRGREKGQERGKERS